MRRLLVLSLALPLASCMTAPRQPAAPQPAPAEPQPEEQSSVVGLTPQELVGRFGAPALQIREGSSLKLQFRGRRCVMDAYLYPAGSSAVLKVTHVDTRLPSGGDIDQAACIFSLRNPG
jgi:hypothetical protein